ncbi:MAG: outer membrane beta-barrel protein [Lautropia sp.]
MSSGAALAGAAPSARAQDAQGDVISLTAGISVTRDSNVARVPDNFDVSQFGASSKADTYLKGSLGVNFDRQISQQRITANAQVDAFKYNDYSNFDNVGYRAGVNYDWVIGRPFFGQVGFNLYRYEPAIQDNLVVAQDGKPVRNQIDRQFLYFSGGMRFTPSWSAIARVDFDRRRNSLVTSQYADSDLNGYEIGTRYAPGTGTEIDLVYRRVSGDYLNLQTISINGEPQFATNNDYKQDAILARIRYRPSEDSLLAGRIGLTKRAYDQSGDARDFNGVTTGFDVEWAPTGATTMRVSVLRDIEPQDGTTVASYAETTLFALRPSIRLTGKITVSPFFEYVERKYKGEVLSTASNRKDTQQTLGVGVNYEFRRNLNFLLDVRREERDSNLAAADFTANVFTVGLQARF